MQYDLVFYPDQNSKEYIQIKDFRNDNTLEGILSFCHQFENYDELVEFIYYMGLIDNPSQNGIFKIHSRISKNSVPKVFARGITYKKEAKFYNLDYLEDYYAEHAFDVVLMNPIIDNHFNFFLTRSTPATREKFYSLRSHINNYKNFGGVIDSPDQPNIFESTRDFVRLFSQRLNGKKETVIHYPNLTLLARNAANYERIRKNYNPNNSIADINKKIELHIESLEQQINHYNNLLSELNETDEAYQYYVTMINKLQEELDEILRRRNPDEVTRH